MPKASHRHASSLAGQWLSKRPGSNMWCRTWFDPATRQTRRTSLGTDDLAEAEREFAGWIAANVASNHSSGTDITLARVFVRYHQQHGRHAIGAGSQRVSLALILRTVPEGITVTEFTLDIQNQVVRTLAADRYAPGTIKRAFGAARAAVNWAWNNGEIDRPIPFLRLPEGRGRERVLSIAELARLWDTEMPNHVRAFLALAIGTAGRPEALLQLTRTQCDVERRTINLNPPGRLQTKKRRPILPMPAWLVPWIEAADGPIVAYRGTPVRKIAGAFQTMRDAAGFGVNVTAYTVRHSIATEMAARGVPELEIAAILGHGMPNIRTTGRYVHVAPDRLVNARNALEAIAADIDRTATRRMAATAVRANCVLPSEFPTIQPGSNPLKSGAGEGIRTLDPNLGKVVLYP